MQFATLTVDVPDKLATLDKVLAVRESVLLTVAGATAYPSSDLRLAIILNGAMLASCNDFGSNYQGTLDLNTTQLVAAFVAMSDQSMKAFSWVLFTTDGAELVNCRLQIQNQPYDPSMNQPTPVTPVIAWSQAYTQGQADQRFVQKTENGAGMRWANGQWYIYIPGTGTPWYPITGTIQNGIPILALGTGVAL